jgi:hypothetical protein
LAGAAAVLRKGFERIFIAGGMEYAALRPYGIHPKLDPLWSTEHMTIIHDGCDDTRFEKIAKYISKSDTALQTLRVCWRNKRGKYNCCECEKCYRTMLPLYAEGVLDTCATFNSTINSDRLANLFLHQNQTRYFVESLIAIKLRYGDSEITSALEKCLQRNEKKFDLGFFFARTKELFGVLDARYLQGTVFYLLNRKGYL